jgi:hypothetical protein
MGTWDSKCDLLNMFKKHMINMVEDNEVNTVFVDNSTPSERLGRKVMDLKQFCQDCQTAET